MRCKSEHRTGDGRPARGEDAAIWPNSTAAGRLTGPPPPPRRTYRSGGEASVTPSDLPYRSPARQHRVTRISTVACSASARRRRLGREREAHGVRVEQEGHDPTDPCGRRRARRRPRNLLLPGAEAREELSRPFVGRLDNHLLAAPPDDHLIRLSRNRHDFGGRTADFRRSGRSSPARTCHKYIHVYIFFIMPASDLRSAK